MILMNQSADMNPNIEQSDKEVIIFALGRCYMLCQLLAVDTLGVFSKNDFKKLAVKLGAKIEDGETVLHSVSEDNSSK